MTVAIRRVSRVIICLLLIAAGFRAELFSQNFTPDITVALDGSGDFTKIQDAIDAVPDNSATPTIIFIKRGLYNTEKLIVRTNKKKVVFVGESRDETIISYHLYVCSNGYAGRCPAEDAQLWTTDNLTSAATLTILGDDFRAENLTVQNTAGPVGQAQALAVRSDRVIFRNCNITGYQDTIYFWSNGKRSYFENCLVVGRTDYIYGGGTVFFQACEIRSWGGGWITAPSTPLSADYGFVFNECDVTYAWNSPRNGDDGALVAFGRPWNDYPKVAWLYCNMTEKIHPLGWPTTWDMSYATTSPDLHLYEYHNTGPGADMSGRADWVGIRALTDEEAAEYTVTGVLAGNDNWDPTAIAPLVTTYRWTGADPDPYWMLPGNWDPQEAPDTNQAAYVEGPYSVVADGGHFAADLSLSDGAILEIADPSEVTYLSVEDAAIRSQTDVSLTGRIRVKDTLDFEIMADTLELNAQLIGRENIRKNGDGNLKLREGNPEFAGYWEISAGNLSAAAADALGKAQSVTIDNLAMLTIDSSAAYFFETPLHIQDGGRIALNADIVLQEFYLNGVIQPSGIYTAATNPGVISGAGSIQVEWSGNFTFVGGANGNWDNPAHFLPAFLPEAGDTVYTAIEMETTPFVFPADIIVQPSGRIRLRGVHSAAGTIYMEAGSSLSYATSGQGFTLDAPIVVLGNVSFLMNSAATPDHAMRLGGNISGESIITALNTRTDTENTGTVVLSGDNQGFTGTWKLLQAGGNPNSITAFEGTSANAFGQGLIQVGANNRVVLSHENCVGEELNVTLLENGRIQLNTLVRVKQAVINAFGLPAGIYNATTHPQFFVGGGELMVDIGTAAGEVSEPAKVYAAGRQLHLDGVRTKASVYDTSGRALIRDSTERIISLEGFLPGLYLVHYAVDGQNGILKVVVP